MGKIFLDTNAYIDIIKKRTDRELKDFQGQDLFISPLSIHILAYTYKYKIPDRELDSNHEVFNLVPLGKAITDKALTGPTSDFEANVQLHSAAETECDIFLTEGKALLNMKFFGKVKINNTPLF